MGLVGDSGVVWHIGLGSLNLSVLAGWGGALWISLVHLGHFPHGICVDWAVWDLVSLFGRGLRGNVVGSFGRGLESLEFLWLILRDVVHGVGFGRLWIGRRDVWCVFVDWAAWDHVGSFGEGRSHVGWRCIWCDGGQRGLGISGSSFGMGVFVDWAVLGYMLARCMVLSSFFSFVVQSFMTIFQENLFCS